MREIDEVFAKLLDELRRLNGNTLSVSVFGSYMTEEFKPWISDIDILIVYRENGNERLETELQEIFEKYSYLNGKMRFHVRLFDPWVYSDKEIMKLPIERMLTYSIPYIKKSSRTLFGENIVQKIPDPSQKEIIESYLNSLVQMHDWLDGHRHFLNGPRLDLTMKSIILRFFNASMGYLAVKEIIETSRRKRIERFLKLLPHSKFPSIHQILGVYENWTGDFSKEQLAKCYEECLELLKYLYSELTREIES